MSEEVIVVHGAPEDDELAALLAVLAMTVARSAAEPARVGVPARAGWMSWPGRSAYRSPCTGSSDRAKQPKAGAFRGMR